MSAKRSNQQILLDLIEGIGTKQTGLVKFNAGQWWYYRNGATMAPVKPDGFPLGSVHRKARIQAARLGKEREK